MFEGGWDGNFERSEQVKSAKFIRLVPTMVAPPESLNSWNNGRPLYQSLFRPLHWVKSVQIRSNFWFVFPRIRTEYREILRNSPYSVRMPENMDQKLLRILALFTQSEFLIFFIYIINIGYWQVLFITQEQLGKS